MQTCLYTVEVNKEKNCYTEERAFNVICQITVEQMNLSHKLITEIKNVHI